MSHLEHDMDEFFQRAAEQYSLKTGESHWQKIADRVKTDAPVINNVAKKKKTQKRYLFAMILLLIALLITNIILLQKKPGATESNPAAELNTVDKIKIESSLLPVVPKKSFSLNMPALSRPEYFIKTKSEKDINEIPINSTGMEKADWRSLEKDNMKFNPVHTMLPGLPDIKSSDVPVVKIQIKNPYLKSNKFYWGIVAGPQFNEVKKQGIRHTDVDAGIIAGYRAGKRLAIETGLFYGEKCYYSDAKFFKMSPDPSMPANMVLMDIQGSSHIASIPVKLRYDLINTRKNKLFTSAGVTSYLILKQDNNYHSMINGTENYMDKSYQENSCYTAAAINVSAGLERHIVKDHFIRVEPYLQIPLKGIGVGSMPVTSAGIHIGIITNKRKR